MNGIVARITWDCCEQCANNTEDGCFVVDSEHLSIEDQAVYCSEFEEMED